MAVRRRKVGGPFTQLSVRVAVAVGKVLMAVTVRSVLIVFAITAGAGVVEGWLIKEAIDRDAFIRDAESFVEAPCSEAWTTVTSTERRNNHRSYTPVLVCNFFVDDRAYSVDSNQSNLSLGWWSTEDAALARGRHYLAQVTPHAYYDAHDPNRAAMSRDVDPHKDGSSSGWSCSRRPCLPASCSFWFAWVCSCGPAGRPVSRARIFRPRASCTTNDLAITHPCDDAQWWRPPLAACGSRLPWRPWPWWSRCG
jgi:hypothetical protein